MISYADTIEQKVADFNVLENERQVDDLLKKAGWDAFQQELDELSGDEELAFMFPAIPSPSL